MDTVEASTVITENYVRYGRYVNSTRSCPGIDGLKSVERRVLLGVRDVARSKLTRSSLVCGHILGNYHPHGECYGSLAKMVRCGFVEGKGNFGDHLSQPAAMRYTSVKANEAFNESVFRFVDFVPIQESEFGIQEPTCLPVPLPLCLASTGSIGIGVGLLSNIPAFSATSLFAAMEKDEPNLLRAPKGLTIVAGDLEGLWKTGIGHVQYGMKCYQEKSDADEGRLVSIITGSPRLFLPDINKIYAQELAEELIYVRDETLDDVRIVISRVKGIKKLTDEDIHKKAHQAATKTMFCRLFVADGDHARVLPLRDWLKICWERYCAAFNAYKKDQLDSLEYRIHLFDLIPQVYPLLLQEKGTREIAGVVNEPMAVIRDIEAKPLRLLRRRDFDAETKRLEGDVRAIKKLTAEELGREFVRKL